MVKTVGVALASLVLPTLVSLKFAAPDYKSLAAVGTLSAILYVVPLWLFEFTSAETLVLRQAIWPRAAVTRSID
jgi:hypothetical protein